MLTRLTNQGRSNYQKSTLYIAELVGGWVGRAREKAIQGCDWFTGSDVFTPSAAPALYWLLLPCVQKELAHVVQLSVFTTFRETVKHQVIKGCYFERSAAILGALCFGISGLELWGWLLATTTLSAQKQEQVQEEPFLSSLFSTGTRISSPGSSQR